jgi:hypothetical protein
LGSPVPTHRAGTDRGKIVAHDSDQDHNPFIDFTGSKITKSDDRFPAQSSFPIQERIVPGSRASLNSIIVGSRIWHNSRVRGHLLNRRRRLHLSRLRERPSARPPNDGRTSNSRLKLPPNKPIGRTVPPQYPRVLSTILRRVSLRLNLPSCARKNRMEFSSQSGVWSAQ